MAKKEDIAKKEGETKKEGKARSAPRLRLGSRPKKVTKYPEKTTINLVRYQTEKSSRADILVIILITLVLVAFGKLAVYDQLAKLFDLQSRYNVIKDELQTLERETANYEEVKQRYNEVTEWYLTDAEKHVINKIDVLEMLEDDIMPYVEITRLQVSGNTVTVSTDITDLNTVSTFLLKLQEDPRNRTATVTTTAAASSAEGEERVTSSVVIYYVGKSAEDS